MPDRAARLLPNCYPIPCPDRPRRPKPHTLAQRSRMCTVRRTRPAVSRGRRLGPTRRVHANAPFSGLESDCERRVRWNVTGSPSCAPKCIRGAGFLVAVALVLASVTSAFGAAGSAGSFTRRLLQPTDFSSLRLIGHSPIRIGGASKTTVKSAGSDSWSRSMALGQRSSCRIQSSALPRRAPPTSR